MIHILLPTMGRPKQAYALIKRIEANLKDGFIFWVLLNQKDDLPQNARFSRRVEVRIAKVKGFWRVLNEFIPMSDPFIWLGDDIDPKYNFLDRARVCWKKSCPNGLGLVALNEGVVKWHGSCFGMTTARWLYVLFGEPYFPKAFKHQFLDTLVADRSKDLDKYFYCRDSIIIHMHHVHGKSEADETYLISESWVDEDEALKFRMDDEWLAGGRQEALERLKNERANN